MASDSCLRFRASVRVKIERVVATDEADLVAVGLQDFLHDGLSGLAIGAFVV